MLLPGFFFFFFGVEVEALAALLCHPFFIFLLPAFDSVLGRRVNSDVEELTSTEQKKTDPESQPEYRRSARARHGFCDRAAFS